MEGNASERLDCGSRQSGQPQMAPHDSSPPLGLGGYSSRLSRLMDEPFQLHRMQLFTFRGVTLSSHLSYTFSIDYIFGISISDIMAIATVLLFDRSGGCRTSPIKYRSTSQRIQSCGRAYCGEGLNGRRFRMKPHIGDRSTVFFGIFFLVWLLRIRVSSVGWNTWRSMRAAKWPTV